MGKSYDAWRKEQGVPEPFVVGGQTFTPRPRLPWKTQTKVDEAIRKLGGEKPDPEGAIRGYFNLALIKGDRERFAALLDAEDDDDDENAIDFAQLFKIMDDLQDLYAGKASGNDESSTDGQ